jgi:hypothetical protein
LIDCFHTTNDDTPISNEFFAEYKNAGYEVTYDTAMFAFRSMTEYMRRDLDL